jgi:hypothetical protein
MLNFIPVSPTKETEHGSHQLVRPIYTALLQQSARVLHAGPSRTSV